MKKESLLTKKFLDYAKKYSWLGVPFILKAGFPKGKFIPYGDLHKEIQLVIDKAKHDAEAVHKGLLDPTKAKRGALIQISRDHAKTSSILGRILWELGNNPNLLIKIVCASEEQAKKRISFLRRHIETNKNLHLLFPHLKPQANAPWSTTQLYVERDVISTDPSVEAAGVLGSFTGAHCVVEGTPIITSKGLRPIEEIKIGDFVFNTTGKFQRVVACANRHYKGKVYYVKSALQDFVQVGLTPDHRILVRYIKDNIPKVDWIEVEQVAKNPKKYMLAFPKLKFTGPHNKWRSDDLYFYISIDTIEEREYDGTVYDLQVKDGNSFCSLYLIMHNCNLLVLDDIVDYRNAYVYPENLKKIEQAVKENWLNILSDDGFFVAIYTPWTDKDVTLQMEKQTHLYYTLKRVIDDNFTPIWPEKYDRLKLIRKKEEIGETAFARQFQGKVVVDKSSFFNKEAIEACYDDSFELGEYPKDCIFFVGVDLGHRKSKGNPQTCIFTLAVTPDKKRLPVSIRVGNFGSVQTAQYIIDVYFQYKPELILVENNGYQEALIEWIRLLDKGIDLPIEGYFTSGQGKMNLTTGIPGMNAEFERGLWIIPTKGLDKHPDNCECGLCTWLRQLKKYPYGLSDCLMASLFALKAFHKLYGQGSMGVHCLEVNPQKEEVRLL